MYNLAEQTNKEYTKHAMERYPEAVPVTLYLGDMLKVNWTDADIIYSSSICFPDDVSHFMITFAVSR